VSLPISVPGWSWTLSGLEIGTYQSSRHLEKGLSTLPRSVELTYREGARDRRTSRPRKGLPMTSQPRKSRQRKLTNIDIAEVSGVDRPAHLSEGWLLAKSAGGTPATPEQVAELFGTSPVAKSAEQSDLPAGAFSLKAHEAQLVAKHLDGLKPGEETEFRASGKGARLGKSASGHPYLTTPASIAKAAGQEWARSRGVGQRPL
jgi:hypothetical protein